MSFVLHFFHAPHVDSVEAATKYVYEHCDDDPPLEDRFRKFVELVTTVYPDLSAEDDDGDDERNLWPEGLDSEWGDEPVVNVGIKTDAVEEGVLSIVASKAVQAGLQMLDPQNAMLYRSDQVVVHHDGRKAPFRMLTPFAAKLMKPAHEFEPRTARDQIGARLREHLAGSGDFALACTEGFAVVYRQHGDVRHTIGIEAQREGDHVKLRLHLWLASSKVSSVWLEALPPEVADWKTRNDAFHGGMLFDFTYGVTDIVPAATREEIARFGKIRIRTHSELEELTTSLCTFVAEKLLPVLDPVVNLPSLATLAFNDEAFEIVRSGYVRLPEQLGTAVLVRLERPEAFEQIATALQRNPHKGEYWRELNDPEGRLLDRLIEHLRAMPGP